MKHTPGPWKKSDPLYWVISGADGGIVGEVWFDRRTEDEQLANVRLIAAAPELLEALKAVRDYATAHGDGDVETLFNIINTAIAKAEGES